jgi:MATE family multidrug resistance protein
MKKSATGEHPFLRSPNTTLVSLSIPVLFSLVAEPLTGLVDTAFVARLGAVSLAALGVGAVVLASVFWIFNFLGIATQTRVAQASGRSNRQRAGRLSLLAMAMGAGFGLVMILVGWLAASPAAVAMGAAGEVYRQAVDYIQIRCLGAPAVLVTIAAFGSLRGLQDMGAPLRVALGLNAVNILLDALLIFGWGPVPAMGVVGAALASAVSQWIGAGWAVWIVHRRIGLTTGISIKEAGELLQAGGDLFVRTGLLTAFLLLCTRSATRMGPDAGAAHQAVRQVWVFTALLLDAFAISGQSLIGYFQGSRMIREARRVAGVVCFWSVGIGVAVGLIMVAGTSAAARLLVPVSAVALFVPAWQVAAIAQPLNAVSFATDGIHWGTGDFRFLRNAVALATGCGALGLILLDEYRAGALTWVWIITTAWIVIRAFFGVARIWPGIGNSPLSTARACGHKTADAGHCGAEHRR